MTPFPPPNPTDRIAWANPGDWPILSGHAMWLDRFNVRNADGVSLRLHSHPQTALRHACHVANTRKRRAEIAAAGEYARRIVLSG